MFDKLKSLVGKTKDVGTSIGSEASRLGKKAIQSDLGKETSRLGKEIMRSDLAKDAAAGAAIGAVVAIPVPFIGPMAGAAIGAGLGVFKNFTRKGQSAPTVIDHAAVPRDIHAELLKLDDLRQKKIITEIEFEAQKKKILDSST